MPKVTYIEFDGTAHTVDVAVGVTLMSAALDNGVPGIDGDCGGNCACATCHLYVDQMWWARIGEPRSATERDVLGFTDSQQNTSRLGYQVEVTEQMEGLIVRLPRGQH